MEETEELLPDEIIARATRRGREYAWALSDIPGVIEAARRCHLVSAGGQLQFRFPHGPTCECYWIAVDTYKTMPEGITNWAERVERSAEAAKASFEELLAAHDLIEEGRKAFREVFSDFEANGGDVAKAMCFVWYLEVNRAEQAGHVQEI